MARSAKITLGDYEFVAESLTVGQAEDVIDPLGVLTSPADDQGATLRQRLAASREIVFVAARAADDKLTREAFMAIRATPLDIFRASTEILTLSGFERPASSGEAGAGETPAVST